MQPKRAFRSLELNIGLLWLVFHFVGTRMALFQCMDIVFDEALTAG